MKELEEVNCEIRRIVDLRLSISEDRTIVERDERESSDIPGEYDYSEGLLGGFLNDANYAWLSRGPSLTVFDVKTGVGVGSWTFCWKVACVGEFPARPEEPPLLVVGLDNGANRIKDSLGLLCVFDFTTSRVLRAIRMPVGIEQACVVSGGAEWEEPNDTPMEMDGIACVALRNLRHVMIDLRRGTWETSNGCTVSNEASPAEMEFLEGKEAIRSERSRKEKHTAYNLLNGRIERHIGFRRDEFETSCLSEEKLTSTVSNLSKIGCLISGCLGRVIVWQRDGSVGWISSIVDENTVATHIAVLEPSDDPRPFYYLWIVFQEDSSSIRGKVGPLLRMYALLFERKYDEERGKEYLNLEADPCLKFEFELDARDRVVGLSTIERETSLDQNEAESRRAEESRLLIRSRERTLLFDLNQWYKEQMPRTIGECKNPNSVLASYGPIGKEGIISCSYVPRTLREYTSSGPDCQEELFYPNSLSLEWVELSGSRLTFRMCRGIQAELLREIAIGGPIVLIRPSETFHRSLSVGLLPFATEYTFASDQDAQREMLLSLCLEQRWPNFLVRCGNEWSDGSAAYLYPKFLKWGIERASAIKTVADRLCENLFDQSGNDIGEAEVRTLRFCSQQLECLSNVVGKLPLETADLTRERRALKRVSVYFQALLWFYDVGLLPECQNLEENPSYRSGLPISLEAKIPYPFAKLYEFYEDKRESRRRRRRWTRRKSLRGGLLGKGMPMKHAGDGPIGRGCEEEKEKEKAEAVAEQEEREEGLFIDELIARECPAVKSQWEREARDGGTAKSRGLYPPPSLQSLLRIYLTNCHHRSESREIENKHQIAIYLLMDLAMLLQGSCSGVDQLIKYPSAFKMSPSLIKLTQAFWLLDHEDSQGFLDAMTGQLVSDSDVKDWHHSLVLGTLVRTGQQKLALTYLRVRKPPLSSIEDQSTMIQLSVGHGLVQSAFRRRPRSHYAPLLTSFFRACKSHGRLADILHLAFDPEEERILSKFLEDEATEDVRSLYYLQRSRYTEARRSGDSRSLEADVASMVSAYNATLPDVMKRFSVKMLKSNLDGDSDSRYPRPMSHRKSYSRSIGLQETAIRKAKETRALRGEAATDASRIPFITAPCATLKSLEDRSSNATTECILFPRFTSNPRKRSFDRTRENGLADGEEENEENKRRKTEETASAAPFHTPLVRRKNDTPGGNTPFSEIPQSILKVRRLVGSGENSLGSESRTIAISSSTPEGRIGESGEHHRGHGRNRINRQIRFSIGRSNADEDANVCRTGEATGENGAARLPEPPRETVENRKVSIVPHLTDVSMESPILLDTTCTASPGRDFPYSPRPRAGLGGMRPWTRNLGRSETIREDGSELFSTSTVLQETTVHSSLSYSGYSTAVLSPDSSFESKASVDWDRHKDNDRRLKPPFPTFSTLSTADRPDARDNDDDDDDDDDNEDDNGPATIRDKIKADWKNGRVPKTPIASEHDSSFLRRNESTAEDERAINDSRIDKVAPFASLSAGHPDTSGLSLHPKNDENSYDAGGAGTVTVDVTDDESSDGDGESVFPPREKSGQPPYDFFNITEDESESSVDELPRPKTREGASRTSECSVVTEEVKETASGGTGEDPRERTPAPVEASVRITRSRGTTSMDRDLGDSKGIPPSPRVYRPERTGSGRFTRASSLAKEVSLSSVLSNSPSTEESMRRMTSSPQKSRQRRAASLAKDDLAGQSKNLEIDVDSPLLRRSARRRSASVQKELPEPTRSLTKRNGVEATPPATLSKDGGGHVDRDSVHDDPKPRMEKRSTRSKDEGKGKSSDKTVQRAEEGDGERLLRRRGSSVPKESQTEYKTRSRRSSSLAKEVEVASPAGNSMIRSKASTEGDLRQGSSTDKSVRTRRSSIQSIPEELEEILSVPFRERNLQEVPLEEKLSTSSTSSTSSASSRRQSSRRTRAASHELLSFETKRTTRSARGRNVLGETITEEESLQVENDETAVAVSSNDIPAMKTRRATSETPVSAEKTPKARRGRRTSLNRQTSTDRFSFSQPENPVDFPHDRKDVGQVPNYVFSPPHTRSKTAIPDRHCRREKSVVSILREENIVKQEEEQQQKKKKIMLKGL